MKRISIILSLILFFVGSLMISGCADLYSNIKLIPSVNSIELEINKTATFEVEIENYTEDMLSEVFVYNENKIIKEVETTYSEGTAFIEILGLKVGEGSIFISTYEGSKKCVINAKVYQPVTDFSLKTEPYIIEEEGFALDFSETDYFNFSPANASYTDVSFFFDDNGVEKKILSAKTIKESDDNLLVTLQTDNGQIDITTQSFVMTAKLDNYPLINAVEFDIDVIEPINVGKVNLIKRGIYNDYFAHDEMIELAQSQSLILISNNIETAYIAFEIQVFSQNVSFEIIANNIEIEILEISPEDFEPTSPFSRFFSIQSANLGNDILEIKAFYEQYDGYEITRSFPVESISMPDKLYVNDKPEFNESVYLYDRNFGNEKSYKFDMNLTVYATDSIFESVSFSIETEAGEAFPPATHWSQYIEVKYKNRIITEDFIISYNDFLNNSLKSPISLVGKEQFDDGALRVKLELNSDLLEQEIIYYVPIIIEEGATKFEVKPLYIGGLSLDIDNGAVNFSGLSVESLTAYIGNISFEYLDNSDLYLTVEQVIINDIQIKITPLSIGQGRVKIILPNGLSVILSIKIEKVLSSAKLSVINSREISLTETDLEGNISYIAINYSYQKENQVNEEPLNIDFRLLLNPSNATLFEMSCEILEGDFVEFDTVKQVLYIRDIGTAKIKITLDLFEIVDFARESNDTKIEFEVEIESYYPLENFSFQKDEIEKISATVYKDSDVGYYYAQQGYSKIEIDLKATLFDGSNIDEVFMYYEDYISWTTELGAPNEVSSSRIGGTYSATGTIDNFGQYKITGNHLQLDCNSPFAHANTNFWIAFTISEYNVNKTAILKISILDYVPLYSVGFYNYVEEIYLSDSNSVHIFNTFMDLKSDCREFDVFFEARDATSESLISATINSSFSEVRITYNQTGTGYGTLYFIPKTSYIDKTHYNYFTSVEVWVSDGTDINNPLIINSATEFVSTMSSVEALSKHFKIASTLDFARITLPYFGEFKGSIVGATASAKLTNIKINALFSEGSNVFGGIFSKLSASAQIKNIVFEGEIAVFVTTKDNVYLGLIAGQNNGRIENVSVILKSSSATILNKSETYSQSTICIGGIVGLNAGIIKNVVDTSAKTFNHILLNQTAEMEVRYEGYSKNTYVGGIAGNNSAVITREMVDGSQLYNTSIYGAIISILSRGINATGGIAGINRNFILEGLGYINSQISGLLVNGNVSAEQHQLSTFTTLGGENVGGICGINNSYVQSCISRVQTHGYNYVGGIAGNDNSLAGYSSGGNPADFDFIKNCKVQAVYSSSFKYMLTAQSYYGKIGAISGNETTEINRDVYEFNNNSANFYYEMDASNKIFPVAYSSTGPNYENIKYNADDDYYILFRYEQMPIEIDEITPEYEFGAGKLATENSDFENKVAYMFYYDAKDNAENDYIRSFNSNRDIPFIFENSDSLILTSLSENILKITSDGKINLFGTGIATIRVSSLLNTTIDTQVYVIITNAFDKFRIIAANTYDLTTGSNVIVYKNSSVELGFEFSHSNIETRDEYHQIIWVEMKNNTDAGIDYQINESTHYIDISMTGNRLILKVNQIAGVKSTNTITFTPKFELNLSTVGKVYMNRENIEDESQNEFDSLITESEKEISIIAIAKKGTEKVGVDFTTRSAEPLDIIEIDVNQITDYEDDYLIISIVKAGEDADAPDDYFLILDYEGYEYNDNKYQYMGTSGSFRFQFNFEKYALNNFDYTGTYYINFIADNGIQQTIIITMEKQEVSGIDLKNYYNIQSIFNDTQKEENYVAVGSTNLLAVEVYPYFSDFDYIKIENDSENEINGSTLVFEVVELMEDK
ncbi:MAG: hypothetical protein PHV79_01680, partial [Clostridia bacterium]|nr:hypothetical protein [Clostridia bacterium]